MKLFRFNHALFPWIILALLLAADLFLLTLPLAGILGYEYSLINSVLVSLSAGLITIYYARSLTDGLSFWSKKGLLWFSAAILILPLLTGFVNTLFFRICPVSEGLLYYLVITAPAFFTGMAAGYFAFFISRKWSWLFFIIFYLLLLLAPAIEIYTYPQIYFYNSITGFFPGTIYDEDIPVDFKLILFRTLNIVFSIILIYFLSRVRCGKSLKIALTVITVIILFGIKPWCGYATSATRLESELGKGVTAGNIDIVYDSSIPEKEIEFIALAHRFYYDEIKEQLGAEPPEKITSWVFRDRNQKRKLFGAGNADVSKPWLYDIYIEADNFRGTLKHELVHAFSAPYGVTPFKVAFNFNPALIEGFATAIENEYSIFDMHFVASLAYNTGYRVDIRNLFTGFNFLGNTSSLSYVYSGSFLKFLGDKYGYDKIKKLYADPGFEKLYGIPADSLFSDYYTFLADPSYNFNKNTAYYFFGYKPLIQKVCPHYLANKTREAWSLYGRENYPGAETLFRKLIGLTESYSALTGYVYSLRKNGKEQEALRYLDSVIVKYEQTGYYYNLEILLGDLYMQNGNALKADSVYTTLGVQAPLITYHYAASVRSKLARTDTAALINYIGGNDTIRYNILYNLVKDNKYTKAVPSMLSYASSVDAPPEEVIDIASELENPDSYSLVKLSEYTLGNYLYGRAKEFAVAAVKKNNDITLIHYVKNNLKFVNWFGNFAGNEKESFEYYDYK